MNKIFRVIWSKSLNVWVVVSELVSGHSKSTSTQRARRRGLQLATTLAPVAQSLLTAGLAVSAVTLSNVSFAAAIEKNSNGNAITESRGFNFAGGRTDNQAHNIIYLGTQSSSRNVYAGSVVIGFEAGQAAQNPNYNNHKEIVTIGYRATTTGGNSVVVGANSRARGGQAVAVGSTVIANASQTVAIGNDVVAGQNGAIAIGGDDLGDKAAIVTNSGEVVGRYTCSSTGGNDGCATLTADYFVLHEDVTTKIRNGQISVTHPDIFLDVSGTGKPVYRLKKAFLSNRANDRNNTYVYSRLLPPEILAKYREHKASGKSLSQVTGNYSVLRSGSKYGDAYAPTWAEGVGSIVLGPKSVALGDGSVAIGTMSYAMGNFSTVLGSGAYALGRNSQAIGNNAYVAKDNSVGVGTGVQTLDNEGMAYGYRAISAGQGSLAIGSEVYADALMNTGGYIENNQGATFYVHRQNVLNNDAGDTQGLLGYAMDSASKAALTNDGLNKGNYFSRAGDNNGVGRYIDTLEKIISSPEALTPRTVLDNATGVLKIESSPDLRNSIVIGSRSASMGKNNIVLGRGAFARSANSMALGSYSYTLSENAMAVGLASRAFGKNSIAIGVGTSVETKAVNSTVVGNASFASDENASIFGASSTSYAKDTAIFGNNSTISQGADNSIIIGHDAFVSVPSTNSPQHQSGVASKNMLAIGNEAHANLANSTALGYASKTDYRASDLLEKAWAPRGGISFRSESKVGVISVGSQGYERRIVNVAGGYRDTDAVNVSQLRALEDRIDAGTLEEDKVNLHFFSVNQKDGGNSNYTARRLATLERREQAYALYVRSRAQQLIMEARKKSGVQVDAEYERDLNARVSKLRNELGNGVLSGNALENNNIINTYNGSQQTPENYNADAAFAAVEAARKTDEERLKPGDRRSILNNDERAALKTRNFDNQGARGTDSIAIGYDAATSRSSESSIAIGKEAKVEDNANYAVAIGWQANVANRASSATVVGDRAQSSGHDSVAIGRKSQVSSHFGIAIGNQAHANGTHSLALGQDSFAKDNAIVIGGGARAETEVSGKNVTNSLVIGRDAKMHGDYSVAVGRNSRVGTSKTTGHVTGGSAFGENSRVEAYRGTALGNNAYVKSSNTTDGPDSAAPVAVGYNAQAFGIGSLAVGARAQAQTSNGGEITDATALGNRAVANHTNSVALGANSKTAGANATQNITHNGMAFGDFEGYSVDANAKNRVAGVVSVGFEGTGNNKTGSFTRQITNVAAGQVTATSTDAINGSQLFRVVERMPRYFSVNSNGVDNPTAEQSNASNDRALAQGSIAIGPYANIGNNATNAIAIGREAKSNGAQASDAVALGMQAWAGGRNTIAIGKRSFSNSQDAIAIGTETNAYSNALVVGAGAVASGAGNNAQNSVAVGQGAQVFGDHSVAVGASSTIGGAKINTTNVNWSFEDVTHITGGSALGENSLVLANRGTALGNNAKVHSGEGAVALGYLTQVRGKGALAIGYKADVRNRTNDADGAIALGYTTIASKANSLALGKGADANQEHSVALGSDAKTAAAQPAENASIGSAQNTADDEVVTFSGFQGTGNNVLGTVSIGRVEGTTKQYRQIINVAAGRVDANSTDAINGSQLYQVANTPITFAGDSGSVQRRLGHTLTIKGKANSGLSVTANAQTKTLEIGFDANATGNLVQGDGVSLTGTLNNRLIGAGNVTVALDANTKAKLAQVKTYEVAIATGSQDALTLDSATGTTATNQKYTLGFNANKLADAVKPHLGQLGATTKLSVGTTTHTIGEKNGALALSGSDDISLSLTSTGTADSPAASISFAITKDGAVANGDNKLVTGATVHGALEAAKTTILNQVNANANLGIRGNTTTDTNTAKVNLGSQQLTVKGDGTLVKTKADNQAITITIDDTQLTAKAKDAAKGAVKVINGTNTTVTEGTEGDFKTYAVNVSNTAIQAAAAGANLKYKADSEATAKDTALSTGLHFQSGNNNITVATEANGVVKYSLAAALNNITSIGGGANDAKLSFGADAVTVNNKKITGLVDADLSATSTDAVTGKQLKAIDNRVTTNTNNIAGNTTKITNLEGKVGEGKLSFKGDTVEAKKIALATGTFNVKGKNGISTKTVDDGIEVSVDTTSIGSNVNLSYKANSDAAKSVSLATGLAFTNGTNTTAEVGNNGVVKFNLNDSLTGITSISNAGTTLALSATGVDVGNKKITSLQAGAVNNTSTDAVNGSQLHTALESIKNAIGGNASNADGSVGAPTFTLNGVDKANPPAGGGATTPTSVNSVGDAISKLDEAIGNLKGGLTDAEIAYFARNQDPAPGTGTSTTPKKTVKLSDGLTFAGDKNITTGTQNNGVTTFALNTNLIGINSITGQDGTAKITFGQDALEINSKKITGLADAALTAQSTDAVTGKQLKATNDRVTATENRLNTLEPKVTTNTNNIAGNTNKITSLEAKVGEGKLSFKGDTVEAKKIALATGTFNVKGKNGIRTKTVDDGIEVSVDTTNIGSNVNLSYKANSDAAKSVSLATGLAFTNGTNTTAEVGDNGVVKFNLNDTLTGIASIANGTGANAAKLSLTDGNGTNAPVINVNGAKLTGGASGAINATSTDFVTGKDVHAAVNEVSNALSNATLRFNNTETNPATNAKSVNLTTDVFTITGDDNVTVALKDKGVALSLNTSALAGDVKLKYKGANIGATDPAKEVALSTGLNFENTTNITTEVGDNGSVKHKLNAELKGITKITKNENGTGPSITLGDNKIEFNNAETVNFGDAKINANIAYTANGAATGKTVTLAKGFNFTNGTHTVATVGDDGVVTFDLKSDLKTAIDNAKDSGITFAANGQGSAEQLVKLTKKFSIEGNSDLTAVVAADGTTGNAKVTLTVNKGGQIADNDQGLVTGATVKAALDPINTSITNINSKVGDGTLKFKGDTVDAKTIALATGTLNVKGKNGISTKTLDDGIEISVDTTNIGSNVNLSYKAAQEGTAKTTTLATGLHFKSGNDNITVATEANGVVKYSLAAALNNITSISNAGTTLALSATGLDVGNKKITSLANGTVGTTSKDAVNGSQLHAALESIKNAIGGNASNADGSVGAPTFTLNGVDKANPPAGGGATTPTSVNSVGDAISKLDEAIGNLKGGLTDAEIAYYSRNPAGAPATGKTTSNKQSTKLSDGLIFEGDHNVRTTAEADGVTKFTLNKKLSGITSIEGDAGTAKITFGQDALEVNSKKITGLQDADISGTSTDAVTGKQLNATNTRVTKLETKVGSGEFNYVGDTGGDQKIALTGKFNVNGKNGISTKSTAAGIEISVDTSSIGENVELSYKADSDQAAKKVKLSDGLVFTKTDNITTATAADGVVTHTLNANLKGIASLKNGDNGPTLKLGDGTANNKTFVVEGAELVDFGDAKINANIAYTANSTAAKKNVKLASGFDFTNGTNTTAEVGDNGVVKFNLNNTLTGINSIANGTGGAGASITLGATDKNITVNGGKITGLADGEVGANSTDAITGKQLHATNERVDTLETKVGEGKFTFQGDTVAAKKIALADGVFHVKGKNGISTKTVDNGIEVSVDTSTISDNIKIKYKASDVGGQAIGTQLEANLSTGFDFASTDNITTAVAANGKVTHTLNAALKDIASIAGKATAGQESTKLTLGAGAVTLSSLGANGAASTTDPKLTGLGSGSIATNSKDAITGHQLNSLATALGLTPANNVFTAPTFTAINKGHIAAGATGLASGNIKTAVDNLISTVNEGIQFGATAVKAGSTNPNRQNLGTTLKVVEGDLTSADNTHFKGNNLKTEYAYEDGVGTISIGLTETPEFKAVELKGTAGVNGTTTTIDAGGVKVKNTANPAKTLAELGKDKLEIVTGTNGNNGDNKIVIGKDGTDANAKGVISGLTERKVGDLANLANDSYGKDGNAGRAATEGAVRDLAEKLNEKSDAGLDFIGSNSTATVVKRKLGEKLTVTGEGTVPAVDATAADNIRVDVDNAKNALVVKLAKALKNIESVASATLPADTDGDSFKLANGEGLTFNKREGSADPATTVSKTSTSSVDGLTAKKTTADSIDNVGVSTAGFSVSHREGSDETAGKVNQAALATNKLSFSEAGGQNNRSAEYGLDTASITDKDSNAFTATATSVTLQDNNAENKAVLSKTGVVTSNANQTSTLGAASLVFNNTAGATPADQTSATLNRTSLAFTAADGSSAIALNATDKTAKIGDVTIQGGTEKLVNVADIIKLDGANRKITLDVAGGKTLEIAKDVDGSGKITGLTVRNAKDNADDYGLGDNAGRAATESALKSLSDQLRGAASPFEYVDKDGKPLEKGQDGKFYVAEDLKNAKWDPATNSYKKADDTPLAAADTEGAGIRARPEEHLPKRLALGNIDSGIGLGNYGTDATEDGTPLTKFDANVKDATAKNGIVAARNAADKLYALDGDKLGNVATVGDLQAIAVAGLTFKGNHATNEVHRKLSDTLVIKGEGSLADTADTASDNIRVDVSNNDLIIKLAKAIKNLDSIESDPLDDDAEGKYFKLGKEDGLTLRNKDDQGSKKVTVGLDGTEIRHVGVDGKSATATYGIDGTELTDKDGKQATVKASEIKLADKAQDPTKTTTLTDAGLVVNEGGDTTTVDKAGVIAQNGDNSTALNKDGVTAQNGTDKASLAADKLTLTNKDPNAQDKSTAELDRNSLTFKGNDGATEAIKLDADAKTAKIGNVTISGANDTQGDNAASITGLANRTAGNTPDVQTPGQAPTSGYGVGDNAGRAATEGAVRELADKLDLQSDSSPFEYVDTNGAPVLKGKDGKFYTPADLKGATWIADNSLPGGGKYVKGTDTVASVDDNTVTIKAKGETARTVGNVASGIGLTNYAATAPAQGAPAGTAPTLNVDTAKAAATSLYGLSGASLNNVATVGDLQAIAIAGLTFKGNAADPSVHRKLGETLVIKGEVDTAANPNALAQDAATAAGNIRVDVSDNDLIIKLAKAIKNLESLESDPVADGAEGKAFKLAKEDGLTLTDKAADGKVTKSDTTANGTTITGPVGADGKNATASYGLDGSSIVGADGNSNTSNAQGTTIAGADGKNAALTADALTFSTKEADDKATATLGKDGLTFTGKDGTETIKIDGNTGKISGITSSVVEVPDTNTDGKAGLADLEKSDAAAVATVGDLGKLGFVVSTSDKDGAETYEKAVRHGHRLNLTGSTDGLVTVTGSETAAGSHELKVDVKRGVIVPQGERFAVDKEGKPLVKVGEGNDTKYYRPEDIGANGQPNDGATAVEADKVATTADGEGFVTGNQVGAALSKSGFIVGKGDAESMLNRPTNRDERINPEDEIRFADGKNSVVTMTTKEDVDATGNKKTVTTVRVDVAGLPVGFSVPINGKDTPITKVGDKFYPVGEDGNPVFTKPDGTSAAIPETLLANASMSMTNPLASGNELGDPTRLGNVKAATTALPKDPNFRTETIGGTVYDARDVEITYSVARPDEVLVEVDGKHYRPDDLEFKMGKVTPKAGRNPVTDTVVVNGLTYASDNATAEGMKKLPGAEALVKIGDDYYRTSDVVTADDGTKAPKAGAMAANQLHGVDADAFAGLADLPGANNGDVITVADAKRLGFVVGTRNTDPQAKAAAYADKVQNANKLEIVGGHNIEVVGVTKGNTREVTVRMVENPEFNSIQLATKDDDGKRVEGAKLGTNTNGDLVLSKTARDENGNVVLDSNGQPVSAPVTITGVAPGRVEAGSLDAVNGGQLFQLQQNFTQQLQGQGTRLSAGIASAYAMASLIPTTMPGEKLFSAAMGTYKGQTALAIGFSATSDNGKITIRGGATRTSAGDFGGSVGAGYRW